MSENRIADQIREKNAQDAEGFNKILDFINQKRGIDLRSYRQNFVFRHLRSCVADSGAKTYQEYISYLKQEPGGIDCLLDALSINVTHFFRDREVWDAFRGKVLPELLKRKSSTDQGLIRVWSAACASGQEPYSLAIMFNEAVGADSRYLIKIWASDVDDDALQRARAGEYDARDFRETDKKLLEKYFEPVYNGRYAVKEEIKKMVRFEKHNLITLPALKFMDVIFCRNVMIYFKREQQELLLNKFFGSMNTDGYLVIAKVETVWDKTMFVPVDPLQKIYQKAHG